jgi:NarL family two-component system response regulator LiaR
MSEQQRIKVMIVDDHMMVRNGLKTFLSLYDDLQVVNEAGDGQQAVAAAREFQPDVILMDVVMPNVDGPAATAAIRRENPAIQVIVLSTFSEQELVKQAIEAGAIGYLLKDVHADRLAQAIRDAHHGRSSLDAGVAWSIIQSTSQPPPLGADLTPREREVLALLADGRTNRQIAQQLAISPATARLHVSNILAKLNAANRTEAVSLALQHNLL